MKKAELCSRYISLTMEIKAMEEEKEELKKNLREDLEEDFRKNGVATKKYGNYTVSITSQKRNIADSEAMKEAGIFDQYSKTSIAETLKVIKK